MVIRFLNCLTVSFGFQFVEVNETKCFYYDYLCMNCLMISVGCTLLEGHLFDKISGTAS